jgi:hypothetical protein
MDYRTLKSAAVVVCLRRCGSVAKGNSVLTAALPCL